jgi:hypothetical protein
MTIVLDRRGGSLSYGLGDHGPKSCCSSYRRLRERWALDAGVVL